MSPSKILLRDDEKHRLLPPDPTVAWGILGAIGLGFAVLAAMDLALTANGVLVPDSTGAWQLKPRTVADITIN